MTQTFDVCIRGAGIVGRTLALLLARERLKVALVGGSAKAPPPAPAAPEATATQVPLPTDAAQHGASPSGHSDVRAYALNAASRTLLQSLRAWPDEAAATAVLGMQVFGDDGGAVTFAPSPQRRARTDHAAKTDQTSGADALAFIVDVPALESRLAESLRYQPLVESVESAVPAALTVVCEGRASASRDALAVHYDVTPYNQCAIATRLACEKPHASVARQWFDDDGRILALLPLGGAAGNAVAVVWSVGEAEMPQLMALLPEEFAARLEEASHGALGKLTLTHERASWPLVLAQARRWIGRFEGDSLKNPRAWALTGDAAHTVHPLAGQGLNLGLADAAELAKALHEREYWRGVADERVLRRYERARKAGLVAMRSATDGLQRLFAREDNATQALRNWGMRGFDRSGPLKAWAVRQAMGL